MTRRRVSPINLGQLLIAAGTGALLGGVVAHAVARSRQRKGAAETPATSLPRNNPPSRSPGPPSRPLPVGPGAGFEAESDWEDRYNAHFSQALAACLADPSVVTFDHAVLVVLEQMFPEVPDFRLRFGTPSWKRRARARVREDLLKRLGPTEAEARAALTAKPVGAAALANGADLGQAVRQMGEVAFPEVSWTGPRQTAWQNLFDARARRELAPSSRS